MLLTWVRIPTILTVLVLGLAPAASAQFFVQFPFDAIDVIPGNGVCDIAGITSPVGGSIAPTPATCTLRAAINETNALGGGTIALPSGVFGLSIAGANEDAGFTGDLDITSEVTITGLAGVAEASVINANGIDRIFDLIEDRGGLTLSGVTLTGGSGTHGGAIQSIRASRSKLERCLLTGNVASGIGGGLYSVQTFWKIIDTTISDNVSGSAGGGIGHSSALLHVEGSTISGNRVEGGTGRGGGIDHTGSLSIWNSTVSGNRALGSGAGIYLNAGSPHEMKNVTITNNLADSDGDGSGTGGGLFVATNAAVDIGDTIIADNRASTTGFDDCAGDGDVVSLGHNLFRDASGCAITGDVADDTSGVDPRLGPLEFNGGFTDTHYPLINSAAVDGGDPNGCTDPFGSPLSLDQRAEPRPTDGDGNGSAICDIGAVETLPEPSQILLAAAALASLAALARRGVGA